MTKGTVLDTLRSVLTFVGGFAIAKGYLTATDLTAVIGALITLLTVGWGIVDRAHSGEDTTPSAQENPSAPGD